VTPPNPYAEFSCLMVNKYESGDLGAPPPD
jgi:hypothetical protein